MTTPGNYALLDAEGNVYNIIVADEEFVAANLPSDHKSVALDDLTDRIGIGWKKARNGRWVAPPEPEPIEQPPPLEEVVLADPLLSNLDESEKAAVAEAIQNAQNHAPANDPAPQDPATT